MGELSEESRWSADHRGVEHLSGQQPVEGEPGAEYPAHCDPAMEAAGRDGRCDGRGPRRRDAGQSPAHRAGPDQGARADRGAQLDSNPSLRGPTVRRASGSRRRSCIIWDFPQLRDLYVSQRSHELARVAHGPIPPSSSHHAQTGQNDHDHASHDCVEHDVRDYGNSERNHGRRREGGLFRRA
jgi:hypothetical protein